MPKVTKSHWVLVNVNQCWVGGKRKNRGRKGIEDKKGKKK